MFPPLLWISVAFLAGIVLGAHTHVSYLHLAWPGLDCDLPGDFAGLASRPPHRSGHRAPLRASTPANLPAIFCRCAALLLPRRRPLRSGLLSGRPIAQIDSFNDRKYDLLVTGTLVDPPDVRDTYTNLRLRVESVDTAKKQYGVGGLAPGARAGQSDL